MRNFQDIFETIIYQCFFNLHDCTFVSQSISRYISFDIIKYENIIKILQVHWCSRQYLEFTITFSLFYLFDWQIYYFFFFTRQNVRARKIGRASEVLCTRPSPIGIRRAICPGLVKDLRTVVRCQSNRSLVTLKSLIIKL